MSSLPGESEVKELYARVVDLAWRGRHEMPGKVAWDVVEEVLRSHVTAPEPASEPERSAASLTEAVARALENRGLLHDESSAAPTILPDLIPDAIVPEELADSLDIGVLRHGPHRAWTRFDHWLRVHEGGHASTDARIVGRALMSTLVEAARTAGVVECVDALLRWLQTLTPDRSNAALLRLIGIVPAGAVSSGRTGETAVDRLVRLLSATPGIVADISPRAQRDLLSLVLPRWQDPEVTSLFDDLIHALGFSSREMAGVLVRLDNAIRRDSPPHGRQTPRGRRGRREDRESGTSHKLLSATEVTRILEALPDGEGPHSCAEVSRRLDTPGFAHASLHAKLRNGNQMLGRKVVTKDGVTRSALEALRTALERDGTG